MTSDERVARAVIGRAGSYEKGVARRQEILDRAVEVFRERGAAGTSLRSIAQLIGVSHAALLHYFDSREQLLVALYERAESQRDTSKNSSDSALDVLVRAAIINVGVPGMVELYTTLVAASLSAEGSPSNEFFSDRFRRIRKELTKRLIAEQAAGRVREDVEPADMAAILIAASDGLQIQWLLEPSIELERTLETFSVLLAPPSSGG